MHFLTKLLLLIALLLAAGCRQAVRSPLLPEAQTREVLRALAKTDKLDRLARAGDPGKVFDDLAREVTSEYARCQASLPQNNAARDEFGRIIDGYSLAGRLFAGTAPGSKQSPVELVDQSYARKVRFRHILEGQSSEREWQSFESATGTRK